MATSYSALSVKDQVQLMYVAYFGRAGDPAGMNHWIDDINVNHFTIEQVGDTFALQSEAKGLYSYLAYPNLGNPTAFVTAIYNNLFERAPDTAGLNYWVDRLTGTNTNGTNPNGEHISAGTMIAAIINGAYAGTGTNHANDVASMTNKITVADYFTQKLIDNNITWDPATMRDDAAACIANVTWDSATIATGENTANASVNAFVAANGQTFTLTTGADNIVGTSGNDTINAAVGSTTTFQTPDVINGGDGTDTLNVTFDGASPTFPAATISNVEVFKIRDAGNTAGLTVDFATIAGETEVYSDRSTNSGSATTFSNLATGTTVGIIGQNGAITGNKLVFNYATGTDAVKLVVADGVKQTADINAITTASTATTATITSKGADNTVGQINFTNAKLTSVTVDAQSNFKADAGAANVAAILGFDSASAAATLTIKGAGKADVGFLDANLDVVDAAANTGGVTAIISAVGQQITGGAGNDTITTLASGALMTKVVDAGAGTGDKLIINGANTVDSTTKGAQFKNFEVLQVNSGAAAVAQDVDNLSANNTFTSAVINQSTTDATGITNMNATMAGAVTVLAASGTGAITFGIKDASVSGNIDTLKLTLDDGQPATVAPATFKLTAPVMTGIEKLEIVNNETTTISTLAFATALTDVKVSGTGAITVTTTGAVDFAANTKFDFSAATGAVSFNAADAQAGAAATGLTIIGSATAANTLADSGKSDVIVGGAKGDTLAFLGGADVITLGGGADVTTFDAAAKGTTVLGAGVTFKFANGDSVAVAGSGAGLGIGFDATKTDTITDFDVTALAANAGTKFTLDTAQAGGAVTVVTSAVVLGTTTVTNAHDFLVVNDTVNNAAYVYQDTNGNKTIDAGDFAIKLVGTAALAANEFSVTTGGDLVFSSL